jgi:hypothetical protein
MIDEVTAGWLTTKAIASSMSDTPASSATCASRSTASSLRWFSGARPTDQQTRGAEAAEQAIRFLHETAFDAKPEIINLVVDEHGAAAEAVFVGTHIGEFAGMKASGRPVRVPYSVYELEGGKITALRIYQTQFDRRRGAGLAPAPAIRVRLPDGHRPGAMNMIGLGRRITLVAAIVIAGLGVLAGVARADMSVVTVAGTGVAGFSGDGGPATAAQLNIPYAVAAWPGGGFLIADAANSRVRRVLPDGRIVTAAGTGAAGNSGDGGPASAARLTFPRGVAVLPDGGYLIADRNAHVIRRVMPDGTITTVAGTGAAGFSGDGGQATAAQLNLPYAATPLPGGGFLIADRGNHAIRRVDAAGRITTVAGTPPAGGFSGDGGPATAASVNAPCAVVLAPDGGFLFPDRDNNRVRRVAPDGTISTVAGNGTTGDAGDGGAATAASVTGPYALLMRPDGTLLIGERGGNRIRSVSPAGTITTIAGTGAGGFNGDGLAVAAQLNDPVGLASLPNGDVLVADADNHRVRLLTTGPLPALGRPPANAPNPTPLPGARRVAPRLERLRARASRRALRLRFRLTAPARVRVDVLRRGRRVLHRRIAGHRGLNVVTLRVRLAPGRYTVRLRANGRSLRRTVRTG